MEFRAHENGRQSVRCKFVGMFATFVLSPAFAGLKFVVLRYLGLRSQSLAPPQALCLRLLRRLKDACPAPQAKRCLPCSAG